MCMVNMTTLTRRMNTARMDMATLKSVSLFGTLAPVLIISRAQRRTIRTTRKEFLVSADGSHRRII